MARTSIFVCRGKGEENLKLLVIIAQESQDKIKARCARFDEQKAHISLCVQQGPGSQNREGLEVEHEEAEE